MVGRKAAPGIRDVGLLMLGAGVLLFALIALHFYVTEVLPHTGGGRLGTYCQSWDVNTVMVTVNSYGEHIAEANVYVDDQLACRLKDIPPNSSDVCKASVGGKNAIYRVVAVTSGGRKLKDAGVCVAYGVASTVPVRTN